MQRLSSRALSEALSARHMRTRLPQGRPALPEILDWWAKKRHSLLAMVRAGGTDVLGFMSA